MTDFIHTPHAERDTLYYHSVPTPVPIFQREAEFAELLNIYQQRAPRHVLEVGTFHGGSIYHFLRLAAPGATIVSVDSYRANVDNRHLYASWTPKTVTLHAIMGDSQRAETLAIVRDFAPYDWIAIDAGHLAAEVRADWRNYSAMCAPGGIVCLHDICPADVDWIQVAPLWRELQAQGFVTQEIVCAYGLDWSGWGLVYL